MSSASVAANSHVVLQNISWETYEALLAARGDDPAPRFTYDEGQLEIRSPTVKHEWLKRLVGRFVEVFTEERSIDMKSTGSTTLRSQLKQKGLEPDESYYVQNEALVRGKEDLDLTVDPPPDLAIEMDITASSIEKLGTYAGLSVPEVWCHEEGIVMYHLQDSGKYFAASSSKAFPGLTAAELNRFLEQRRTLSETSLIKAFRKWCESSLARLDAC